MAEGDGYLYIADDSLYTPSLQAIPDAQPTHPLDTHAMAGGRPTAAETQDAESQSEDPDADLVDAVFSALQTAADTFAGSAKLMNKLRDQINDAIFRFRKEHLSRRERWFRGWNTQGSFWTLACLVTIIDNCGIPGLKFDSANRYYADSCVGGGDIDITNAVKLAVQLAGGMAGIPAVTEFFKGLVGNATTLGAAMSHADGRSLGCGGTPSRGRNPKTIHYYNYGFVVRDRAGGCGLLGSTVQWKSVLGICYLLKFDFNPQTYLTGGGRNKLLKAARTLCEMAFGVDTEKVEYYTALFRRYRELCREIVRE